MLLVLAVRVGGTGVSEASEAQCVACAQANPQPVQSSQLARRRATRTSCSVAAPMPLKHVRGKARYSFGLPPPSLTLSGAWTDVRSAVFIVKVQLARARSVPPPGQPATRPASARARRVDWLAKALSCGTPTDGALNTQVDWRAAQHLAHRRLGLVRGEVALQKARARHLHAPWSLIMPTQRL